MPYTNRLWIAMAPAGVWSSGPAVIPDHGPGDPDGVSTVEQYREMGWEITGPYELQSEDSPRPKRIIGRKLVDG